MTLHWKEKERLAHPILDGITIDPPDHYVNVPHDRYRYAGTERYANVPPDRYTAANRYGAPTNRYAAATANRYRAPGRYAGAGVGHKLIRKIILTVPQVRTEGQLLWLPVSEFERSFEEFEAEGVWQIGSVVEFDYAAESLSWLNSWDDGEAEEDMHLLATPVDAESDTFMIDDWGCGERESEHWPEVMAQALQFRAELLADPERITELLHIDNLRDLDSLAGLGRPLVMPMEVTKAIAADSTSGLGAAALDYAVWRMPGLLGPTGARLAERLELLAAEEWVRLDPVENFLLHTGSLHPGTVGKPHLYSPDKLLYPMTGDYVVAKVHYYSDPTGTVIGGWRSAFLEPVTAACPP